MHSFLNIPPQTPRLHHLAQSPSIPSNAFPHTLFHPKSTPPHVSKLNKHAARTLFMPARAPIRPLADFPVAPVTAPGEEVGNRIAIAALAVAAVAVAAAASVLAVAVAAFGTAPVIPCAWHGFVGVVEEFIDVFCMQLEQGGCVSTLEDRIMRYSYQIWGRAASVGLVKGLRYGGLFF